VLVGVFLGCQDGADDGIGRKQFAFRFVSSVRKRNRGKGKLLRGPQLSAIERMGGPDSWAVAGLGLLASRLGQNGSACQAALLPPAISCRLRLISIVYYSHC